MTTDGCAPPVGGPSLEGRDLTAEAVVQGVVRRAGVPEPGAYVRLLDGSGEFTAEVVTSDTGAFRFFAGPGAWTVRTLAPRAAVVDNPAVAVRGEVVEVEVVIG